MVTPTLHPLQRNVYVLQLVPTVGLEKIDKAGCEEYERCIIRAKVISRGVVDGHQNWTVLRV